MHGYFMNNKWYPVFEEYKRDDKMWPIPSASFSIALSFSKQPCIIWANPPYSQATYTKMIWVTILSHICQVYSFFKTTFKLVLLLQNFYLLILLLTQPVFIDHCVLMAVLNF